MKQLFTILLGCISFIAGAQSRRQHRVDSMRIALTYAREDTDKIMLLLKISNAFINENPDESIRYAQQAMELAQKFRDKKDEAEAANRLGIVYNDENKYFKALKNYRKELKLARELKDEQSEGGALCNIGLVYMRLVYLNKALDNFNQAKTILEKIDDKPFLANTIAGIGSVHVKKMEYTLAIGCYRQAFELYKATDNKKGMARTGNQLSWLYYQKGEYDSSENHALHALALAGDVHYTQGIKEANEMLDKIHASGRRRNSRFNLD